VRIGLIPLLPPGKVLAAVRHPCHPVERHGQRIPPCPFSDLPFAGENPKMAFHDFTRIARKASASKPGMDSATNEVRLLFSYISQVGHRDYATDGSLGTGSV
jgi:hypothetical protein